MRPYVPIFILLLAGCGSPGSDQSAPAPSELRTVPVQIAEDVSRPYDRASYPKTYATWGAARMTGDIQALREDAAKAVALRPECDAVMLSEVSDRSAPPAAPQVFVDCENGNRWRYSADEPLTPRPPDQLNVYGG